MDGEEGMLLNVKSLSGVELEMRVPASGTPLTIKELCKNLAEKGDREIMSFTFLSGQVLRCTANFDRLAICVVAN